MKRLFLCWFLFGSAACLQAQQASPAPSASPGPTPTLPPGPLLKSAPDRSSWLVTTTVKPVASATASPAATASPKPAATNKGKATGGQKIGSVVYVWATTDNGKEERWGDGKTMVTTNAAWKVPLFSTGTPEEFPRPSWISRKNIKEIRKQGDKEYWVFRDRIFPGGESITKDMLLPGENAEDLKVDATAVIDASTRLPVGVQVGEETSTYKFDSLPDGASLSVPPELAALLAKRQQLIESAVRKPVRP